MDTVAGVSGPDRLRPGGRQVIPRPEAWRLGDPSPWHSVASAPVSMDALVARVRSRARPQLAPAFPEARNAAVLVLLHDGEDGPEALFTRRSAHLRNHRNEISFPGGRMDPGELPPETALREAREEVGLDPSLVTIHGELDHMSTVVSQSYIVPVVGTIRERPTLVAAPAEVDRMFWVSLTELSRVDTYREEWWGTPPLDRPLFFYELDDETIWGATARMLHQLLRLAHGVDTPEPPAY